jgi:hypothetical protein
LGLGVIRTVKETSAEILNSMDGDDYLYPAMELQVAYLEDKVDSTVYLWRVDVEMLHEAKIAIHTGRYTLRTNQSLVGHVMAPTLRCFQSMEHGAWSMEHGAWSMEHGV